MIGGLRFTKIIGCACLTGVFVFAGFGPAWAQGAPGTCEGLGPAERVTCLRRALAEAEEALQAAQGDTQPERNVALASPPSTRQSLGLEQVARREGTQRESEDAAPVAAMIVASERVHPNRLQVRLEDGQIWRQIQGDTQIVELGRNARVPAEIWSSGLGGYRLRLVNQRRVLKVERIR